MKYEVWSDTGDNPAINIRVAGPFETLEEASTWVEDHEKRWFDQGRRPPDVQLVEKEETIHC